MLECEGEGTYVKEKKIKNIASNDIITANNNNNNLKNV